MPVPNPYQGTHYEHDPEMQQALRGTPAEPALTPSRKGTWKETLAQLASWMGMALPGRGGVNLPGKDATGLVRFPLRYKVFKEALAELGRLQGLQGGSRLDPKLERALLAFTQQKRIPIPIKATRPGPGDSSGVLLNPYEGHRRSADKLIERLYDIWDIY